MCHFSHRNVTVRKTTAQFLSFLAERMGANRVLSGAKDVTEKMLTAAAHFLTDGGPETRYLTHVLSSSLLTSFCFPTKFVIAGIFHRQKATLPVH